MRIFPVVGVLFFLLAVGIKKEPLVPLGNRTPGASPAPQTSFTDVTEATGLDFTHFTGAYGKKYFPELSGSGGGFFDYDGDGWEDILLLTGKNWPSNPGDDPTMRLFRNQGDGTFEDVTTQAGLDTVMYGMGMAAADYDNDGDLDLLVTATGPNHFFRNDGGTFTDITWQAGLEDADRATSAGEQQVEGVRLYRLEDPAWSTSALFFDYDNDGFLDLYVANYVEWSEEIDLYCTLDGETKAYCTPEIYRGAPSRLYHNQGDGTLEDVTRSSGVYREEGKALGVALLDFNEDGYLDLAVANDTQPDFLYQNNGDGTFKEIGLLSGMALDGAGRARAGMGIDVGVVDDTGEETIFVGNFSNEMIGVYKDMGGGAYIDRAVASKIGRSSLLSLTFGLFLFDYDLDFDLDLFAANGHIQPEVEAAEQAVTFKQVPLLYQNDGSGVFTEVGQAIGGPFRTPIVGRAAAYADYDHDGDLDVLVTANGDRAYLLRNERLTPATPDTPFVRVHLEGVQSNRDGIGARIVAFLGKHRLPQYVKTGSSYLSQHELTVTFGLGAAERLDAVEVHWPSGVVDTVTDIPSGAYFLIREGVGRVAYSDLKQRY